MNDELLYQVSLTLVPGIGKIHARQLVDHFREAKAIFHAKYHELTAIEGLGEIRASAIKKFSGFKRAEDELRFIEQLQINPLFIANEKYPKRLLNCSDPPTLLYSKGFADLNASRVIAVIGSRIHTDYGKQLAQQLISDLATQQILIVSGLAYGIDAIAHRSALNSRLPTAGVLAHGLDMIYPVRNAPIAREMIQQNGMLLTEFMCNTNPDKHNFPTRNRIVAGMSDATIVIETSEKGGSMITAALANGYNRDVFAFPGRTIDAKSEGCNQLIKTNRAQLITCASDLLEIMNWDDRKPLRTSRQKEMFIEMNEQERKIVSILQEKEFHHIDDINFQSGFSTSTVAGLILSLELRNVIVSLPGKRYRLS